MEIVLDILLTGAFGVFCYWRGKADAYRAIANTFKEELEMMEKFRDTLKKARKDYIDA